MGKGDIYQEEYDNIISLCIRCSRGSSRNRPIGFDSMKKDLKQTNGNVTREEFRNLLEKFKTDILGTLTMQLDVLQAKQKQAITEQNLAIFCLRCQKKHNHRECLLEMV